MSHVSTAIEEWASNRWVMSLSIYLRNYRNTYKETWIIYIVSTLLIEEWAKFRSVSRRSWEWAQRRGMSLICVMSHVVWVWVMSLIWVMSRMREGVSANARHPALMFVQLLHLLALMSTLACGLLLHDPAHVLPCMQACSSRVNISDVQACSSRVNGAWSTLSLASSS